MADVAPAEVHVSTGFGEDVGEALGVVLGDHTVYPARGHEDGHTGEVGRDLRLERNHRPEQHCGPQQARVQQDGAGRHVGPVGVADGDDLRRIEAVLFCGGPDESGQLVRTKEQVFVVENALGEPAEEAQGTVFGDLAAGRKDGGAGEELLAEWDQVFLVTARAVQGQERRTGLIVAGEVAMVEAEVRGHTLSPDGTCKGGSTSSSLSRRVSSQGGSLRCVPSSDSSSSTAKPGGSVAISNRTPPGSRK